MPRFADLLSTNATLRSKLPAPVAVVVGATSGIGEATALKLAKLADRPSLHLVGRSQASADRIIKELTSINANGTYRFHSCDVSLVSDVKRLTGELKTSLQKLNFLVLTPGLLSMKGRDETAEGHDRKMMLHYYSRMLWAREMSPLLEKTAQADGPQNAKVLSVLDAVNGNLSKLHWDDLDLKSNFSLPNAANHCTAMNDASLQHLSQLHPSVTYIHLSPGFVKTNLDRNLPYLAQLTMRAFSVFATKPEDCAERTVYALANDSYKGWALLDTSADPVKAKSQLIPEEQRVKIWDHTQAIVGN